MQTKPIRYSFAAGSFHHWQPPQSGGKSAGSPTARSKTFTWSSGTASASIARTNPLVTAEQKLIEQQQAARQQQQHPFSVVPGGISAPGYTVAPGQPQPRVGTRPSGRPSIGGRARSLRGSISSGLFPPQAPTAMPTALPVYNPAHPSQRAIVTRNPASAVATTSARGTTASQSPMRSPGHSGGIAAMMPFRGAGATTALQGARRMSTRNSDTVGFTPGQSRPAGIYRRT